MSIRAPSSGLAAGSAVCKVKKGRLFGQLPSAFLANIYAISPPIAIFRPEACVKPSPSCCGITKNQYATALTVYCLWMARSLHRRNPAARH